ncbi:MAG TPA: P-loop NTPase fold protein, partial [Polyangiaceae bacterium]|nr:P-loop NTPase fold protein [Polyangiaceae bacterium]
FPDSPALLLASLEEGFKLSGAKAQTAFRERFRRHFADVCAALAPRVPVLFVDDLDRCEPPKTAAILEGINYLVSSGRCFVILGIARDVVEAQLAHHYKELADSFAELVEVNHASSSPNGSKRNRRARKASVDSGGAKNEPGAGRRLDYVRNYLRKLINLNVRVPALDAELAARLFEGKPGARQEASAPSAAARYLLLALDTIERAWASWGRTTLATLSLFALGGWLVLDARGAIDQERAEQQTAKEARLEQLVRDEADIGRTIALSEQQLRQEVDALETNYGPEWLTRLPPANTVEALDHELLCPALGADEKLVVRAARCWQARAVAVFSARRQREALHAALEEARLALRKDDTSSFELALTRAATAADALQRYLRGLQNSAAPAVEQSPGPTGPTAPPRTNEDATPATDGGLIVHHEAPPLWPYALALSSVLVLLTLLRPSEPYELYDREEFKEALQLWSPFLISRPELAAPREVKRFRNKARYIALRLRPTPAPTSRLRRWLEGAQPANAEALSPGVPEPWIVALTALQHVDETLLDRLASGAADFGGSLPPRARDVLQPIWTEHCTRFGELPSDGLTRFRAVVGEYRTVDDRRVEPASSRRVPRRAPPGSTPADATG